MKGMRATNHHRRPHRAPILAAETEEEDESPDYDPWEDIIDYAENLKTAGTQLLDQSPDDHPGAVSF